MNIELIRLTPDELEDGINFKEVANAATGKAIKKILDIIGISEFGYDVHCSCQLCGGQACIDTAPANELSALKKQASPSPQ